MNWLKKLRVHLRPYLLLAAIVSGIVKGMDDANKSGEDDDIQ